MTRLLLSALLLAALAACETGAPPPSLESVPTASSPAAVPAAGAALTAEDLGLIDRYDPQALRSILTELNYRVLDSRIAQSGKPTMSIEAGQLAFELTGDSCDGQGDAQVCRGVQMSVLFAPADDVDVDEEIAKANRTLRPAKLFRSRDTVVYERYLIMDGGVSRENLKMEISVYVEILGPLFELFNP